MILQKSLFHADLMLKNHFSLLSILKTIFGAYNFCENCEAPPFGVKKKKKENKEKLNYISTKNIKQKTVFNINNNKNQIKKCWYL